MNEQRLTTVQARRIGWVAGVAGVVCVLGTGCFEPFYRNEPLQSYDAHAGYRFDALDAGEGNGDDLFVCLTFSGGGMRAAALAYGVLQGLQETELSPAFANRPRRSLLDEVDIISSVSGGSFTALGFGLWREKLFDGTFAKRFLKSNIQSVLGRLLLRPSNLLLLPWVLLDRIDIAASYYDDEIFDHGSYADLIERNERPFIVVNATNLSIGQRFEFTQDDFDVLGSNLASVPVAWAAAASSAFPIVLSPLRFKYHPPPEGSNVLRKIITAPQAELRNRRQVRWATSLTPPVDKNAPPRYARDEQAHRFLYLVDGGLADNMGLTYVIQAYRFGAIRRRIDAGRIKRLVVIVVDAGTRPPENMESMALAPGILRVGYKTGTTSMDNFSAALVGFTRHLLIDEPRRVREAVAPLRDTLTEHCPDAPDVGASPGAAVERHLIVINFDAIDDLEERERLLALPTSFSLPARDVDDLIRQGRLLLRNHPEFVRLLTELEKDRLKSRSSMQTSLPAEVP